MTGTSVVTPEAPTVSNRPDVELRLPAESAYVAVLRMTTAGLAEMGWKIAVDELAEREARQPRDEAAEAPAVPPRRMRAVGGGA